MTKRGGWNNWVGWHFAINRGRLIRFIDAHGLYLVVDTTQIKIHNASVLIIFIIQSFNQIKILKFLHIYVNETNLIINRIFFICWDRLSLAVQVSITGYYR